jgi:hypothetical protein
MLESVRTFDALCRSFDPLPFVGKKTDSFGIPVKTEGDLFIPPLLLAKDPQEDPHVTLISARGAAGKSKAAKELAVYLNVPLWLLEGDKAVSGTSLEYTLSQYLGTHDVTGKLDPARKPIVIIDSLDEARARVSSVSWTEFIESLGRLAEHGLRYVLCGRERTLEEVWATLCDLDLSVAWWEISHFAPEQCVEYVDGVVKKRDRGANCTSPEYKDARDAAIAAIRSAADGTHADTFIGYAPVLDAIAAMLIKNANFLRIRQRFENESSQAEGRIELLKDILGDLLLRDQGKVKKVAEDLGIEPVTAYTPKEQVQWLCHLIEGADPPGLQHISTIDGRQKYVEQIVPFAEQHPFCSEGKWASPIFEAYVASVEFHSDTFSSERLIDIGHKSGFLLDFVGGDSDLLITESQFAALHASIIASEWAESMTSISIEQASDDSYEGTFAIKRGDERTRSTRFDLMPGEDGVLQLLGPLAELSVRSRNTVVVPGKPQGTMLGPDLFIHASAVRFEGPALEFSRRPEFDGFETTEPSVVVEARETLKLPPMSTQLPPQAEFELRVPKTIKFGYPWYDYKVELVDEESPNGKVVRLLNKLMSLTRNHGHAGERGTFVKKFEGRQPFPPGEFNAALRALVDANVVRVDNDMVFLRAEWEAYRYSGKAFPGQRQLADVMEAWAPVIAKIEESIDKK